MTSALRRGLFFTGTDTDVGKTFIMASVVRLLRRQGHTLRVCKPVATGASWIAGRWLARDTIQLAEAADISGEPERVTRWTFPDPVAPPVASHRQGLSLSLSALATAVLDQDHPEQTLLVEGVGGLLCPLTDRETVAELAAVLRLPLVVVARRSLGTLNHTLLTLEVARGRGLPVVGVVVTETVPINSLAEETNVEELRSRLEVPLLAVVSHQASDSGVIPTSLEQVDWWRLCQHGTNYER